MSEPRILITGNSGYIGSVLTDLLDIPHVGINSDGISNGIEQFKVSKDFESIEYVIHMADMRLDALNAENINHNVQRHQIFLDSLKQLNSLKKVIFTSSCSVYGISDDWITEESLVNPTSFYAESKLKTEQILKESGLPFSILRFGTAYGLSQKMRWDLLINALLRSLRLGEQISIFQPKSWRPYISTIEFANALIDTIKIQNLPEVVNIASVNLSKENIIEQLKPYFSGALDKVILSKDNDPRSYRVDTSLAKSLGFSIGMTIEQGIVGLMDIPIS